MAFGIHEPPTRRGIDFPARITYKTSMKTTKRNVPSRPHMFGQPAEGGLEAERRAFERQRVQLMRRHAGEYVALCGGRVVDHHEDDEVLAARMFNKVGNAPFYLALLEEPPAVYELPSPELAG
jgi:hypothetical protein